MKRLVQKYASRGGLIFAVPILVLAMFLFAFTSAVAMLMLECETLAKFWLREWRQS